MNIFKNCVCHCACFLWLCSPVGWFCSKYSRNIFRLFFPSCWGGGGWLIIHRQRPASPHLQETTCSPLGSKPPDRTPAVWTYEERWLQRAEPTWLNPQSENWGEDKKNPLWHHKGASLPCSNPFLKSAAYFRPLLIGNDCALLFLLAARLEGNGDNEKQYSAQEQWNSSSSVVAAAGKRWRKKTWRQKVRERKSCWFSAADLRQSNQNFTPDMKNIPWMHNHLHERMTNWGRVHETLSCHLCSILSLYPSFFGSCFSL